jgi:cyclopropane-fatty-acyl-phospholipid synthase
MRTKSLVESVSRSVPRGRALAARASQARPGLAGRWLRSALLQRLRGMEWGLVTLRDPAGEVHLGRGGVDAPRVRVEVLDPSFWADVALGGSVGAGESYVAGRWRCDDLPGLVRILVRNRSVLDGMERGLARLAAPLLKLAHRLRDNSRDGSRRNIAGHYDLGNDLYALFLDPTMMYSCAVFEHEGQDLHAAQLAKLERICRKLDLRPEDHLLEIGTGWGAMAVHAATRYGCRVTTTTISREQHALAVERVRAAGVADRVTVLLEDYRELAGRYDKLVSIEMIEAVGERHLDTYFRRCSELLEPHGAMLLQVITMQDQFYDQMRRNVDFIQRHVFPGSHLPSVGAIAERVARCTDMRIAHLEDITAHYVTTLRLWRERFLGRLDEVQALGFGEEFSRLWEFYLAYCEGGFAERSIGDVQILLTKPLQRGQPVLGLLS